MLSLCELKRATRIIQSRVLGAKLKRVVQPEALKLILTFESPAAKWHVFLSCSPDHARMGLSHPPDATGFSSSFCECAHAHLPGSTLSSIECAAESRQVAIHLQSRSANFTLVLSILGGRSNIYLLDSDGKLVHAARPLEETRLELKIGEAWIDPRGRIPSDGADRWESLTDEAYLEAMDKTYQQLESAAKADLLARRIQQALKKERAFLDRKSINLQEDLGEARQAEGYRLKGELLKGILHTIEPGAARAEATDFGTGDLVEIELDPRLSPAENLESYFARYQKQARGVQVIRRQLEEVQSALVEMDGVSQRLEAALRSDPPDIQAMESIEAVPQIRRLIHRYSPGSRPPLRATPSAKKKEIPSRLLPKRYKTQDGLEIWVGRSDEGNDYLTTRLARGNDLFLHLEGYPGSHVVLRTEGRPDPPPEALLEACELAVHFSKMKNATRADVHVAPVKNVKKPKGAKSGLVYVRSGKTIHLKRDPKRLQTILAARLD